MVVCPLSVWFHWLALYKELREKDFGNITVAFFNLPEFPHLKQTKNRAPRIAKPKTYDIYNKIGDGVPAVAQQKRIWLVSMRTLVWSGIWCCHECSVGHRYSSDPALLWLWQRPAAIALIWLLAWELPYASGVALKRQKKKKNWW